MEISNFVDNKAQIGVALIAGEFLIGLQRLVSIWPFLIKNLLMVSVSTKIPRLWPPSAQRVQIWRL